MFESLVIVTREGVEAALVVAIVLASLKRSGATRLVPWVYAGVAAALGLSIAAAVLVPPLRGASEQIEGWTLLAGGLCVVTLTAWMHRVGSGPKARIESRLERLSGRGTARAGWGVLLFVAFMVAREGLETVLFLTAVSFNTDGLARLLGGVLGIGVAFAFAVLFVRGTVRVDLRRFFQVTTAILAVLSVQLLVGAYHEFAEAGYLPASRASMSVVGPIVRYESLIFAAAVLLTLLAVGARGRAAAPAEDAAALNPAERRRLRARRRRELLVRRGATAAAAAVVLILVTGFVSQAQVPGIEDGAAVALVGGRAALPAAALEDGHVHHFHALVDGVKIRFFVVKKPRGELATLFDACEICGGRGYYEEKGNVICRNCMAPMNAASLGRSGGCNPIPLPAARAGGQLVITARDLAAASRYFDQDR